MAEVKNIATRDSYGRTLQELSAQHPDLVVLDADLSVSTCTAMFQKVAPERFFECGIAEANMIGVAAGLSNHGADPPLCPALPCSPRRGPMSRSSTPSLTPG